MLKLSISKKLLIFLSPIVFANTYSQSTFTQTVRGSIKDANSKAPLIGATIVVEGIGTTTNVDGKFRLENVPVGRHFFTVSYIGYEPYVLSEVLITSGKEAVLDIEMTQSLLSLNTVVVSANTNKDKAINTMATVSARTISVEEANRYAGGFDDPARLASGFSGVATSYTSSNAIVIRGNSPKGVLWRFEGADIPAAFHFPNADVIGGGGVTILSSHLLANSDFYTGAFPAEFGNATSGVFDVRLRTGNAEKREYTAQISLLGTDFSAEGPFVKGKNSTYLFNYRYSTLGLISPVLPVSGIPTYQDLCFKLDFPTKKIGTFSLWGLGAYDVNKRMEEKDSTKWENDQSYVRLFYKNLFGTLGVSHKIILGSKTFWNSSLTLSSMYSELDRYKFDSSIVLKPSDYIESNEGKLSFKSVLNNKISSKVNIRSGIIANQLFYNQLLKTSLPNQLETFETYVDGAGTSLMLQGFTQSKIQLTPALYSVIGLHSMHLGINNKTTIEPRASLVWNISPVAEISAGYGLHSQMEELRTYMVKINSNNYNSYPNKELDFVKHHHYILGYNQRFSDVLRLRVEAYYQALYNISVIAGSSFSMINFINSWSINQKLENIGTGKNYGIDMTLERFLKNDFYYLITLSLFDSKYKGGDGIERNTRYNRNFVANTLVGKEFNIGNEKKNNLLGVSLKITFMGGLRYSGYNETESLLAKNIVWDNSQVFEKQFPNSTILDFTITYRKNKLKYSNVWFLMVKNATMTPDYMDPIYDWHKKKIIIDKMAVIIPSLGYKIEF